MAIFFFVFLYTNCLCVSRGYFKRNLVYCTDLYDIGKSRKQTGENVSQTWTENTQKCIETKEKWAVRKVEFAFEIRYTVCVITAENRDASDL